MKSVTSTGIMSGGYLLSLRMDADPDQAAIPGERSAAPLFFR
jgi:hypothetical protein